IYSRFASNGKKTGQPIASQVPVGNMNVNTKSKTANERREIEEKKSRSQTPTLGDTEGKEKKEKKKSIKIWLTAKQEHQRILFHFRDSKTERISIRLRPLSLG
ncbi:hypothetical protein AVEN_162745-2-1, partial [Araneus ventricosus]